MTASRFQMYDEFIRLVPDDGAGHVVPRYQVRQIKTPIALFNGAKDTLPDVKYLTSEAGHAVFCINIQGLTS